MLRGQDPVGMACLCSITLGALARKIWNAGGTQVAGAGPSLMYLRPAVTTGRAPARALVMAWLCTSWELGSKSVFQEHVKESEGSHVALCF